MTSILDESPAELAVEALRLVEVDPYRATAVAQRAAALAVATKAHGAHARALRAQGTALRKLGQPTESERLLRQAVAVAERHGELQVAAEARMSLSYVLLETGRPTVALRQIDSAISRLEGVDLGRARAQRALLLQRTGHASAALDEFAEAIPALRRHGDRMWETRALINHGVLLAYDGRISAADLALRRAEALATDLGMPPLFALARWNRGFVAGRAGDVPAALTQLDEAEAAFHAAGLPEPALLVDRCEILLSAGLAREASEAAARAVQSLAEHGRHADRAEALVTQAQAVLADHRPVEALRIAEDACRLLRSQHRPGWLAAARYTMLRARWECGDDPKDLLPAARLAARQLEEAGLAVAALDARLIVGRLALAAGRPHLARAELATVAPHRRGKGGRADIASRAWHARALLHLADGEPVKALSALQRGIRVLDDYRATVGATELRVQITTHASDLASLGLELALDRGTPRQVLRWLDRCRAGTLRFRPLRPPSDDALAAELTSLRMVAADLERAQLAGAPTAALARRVEDVEDRIRRRTRALAARGEAPAPQAPVGELVAAASGRYVLVALLPRGERIVALVVRDGRVTKHDLGAVARPALLARESLAFALRLLLARRSSQRAQEAAGRALEASAAELDELLLAPIAGALGGGEEIVLLPPAELAATPWGLLPRLADRPVTVAPSPTAWLRAVRDPRGTTGRAIAIAGPGLPAAEREARCVATAHPDAVVLAGAEATASAALAAADGAALVHFACHGRLRSDNPLFSCLVLADGPLTVYDLERLNGAPTVVVLSACESAQSAIRPGDELLGLAAALLATGSRTLIAAAMPVPDDLAADVMTRFHERLAAGASPAAALAMTRSSYAGDPARRRTVGAYVCLGAG
ncbi:MAG: CHAT domain-containing protein [Frankiaceae bacterium]